MPKDLLPVSALLSTERFPIPPQPQGDTGGAKATRCSGAVAAYLAPRLSPRQASGLTALASQPAHRQSRPCRSHRPLMASGRCFRGGLARANKGKGHGQPASRDAALILTMSIAYQGDGSGTGHTVRSLRRADRHRPHPLPGASRTLRRRQCSGQCAGATMAARIGWGAQSIRTIIAKRAAAVGVTGRVSPGTRSESVPPSLWQPPGAGLVELQEAGDWQAPTMPAHYARHQLAARGAVAKLPLPGGPATACEQQQY